MAVEQLHKPKNIAHEKSDEQDWQIHYVFNTILFLDHIQTLN